MRWKNKGNNMIVKHLHFLEVCVGGGGKWVILINFVQKLSLFEWKTAILLHCCRMSDLIKILTYLQANKNDVLIWKACSNKKSKFTIVRVGVRAVNRPFKWQLNFESSKIICGKILCLSYLTKPNLRGPL